MNDEAKRVHIRWRRGLFVFHLLLWLIARLAVGSIGEMPPAAIYDGLSLWGMVVFAHGLLLAVLDGRDRADLPFAALNALVEPRERRRLLLIIDALIWVMFTTAIAARNIPYNIIVQYVSLLGLAWLALTAFGLVHLLLVIYAEVYDRSSGKRKREESRGDTALGVADALLDDDGELVDEIDLHNARADKRREDAL